MQVCARCSCIARQRPTRGGGSTGALRASRQSRLPAAESLAFIHTVRGIPRVRRQSGVAAVAHPAGALPSPLRFRPAVVAQLPRYVGFSVQFVHHPMSRSSPAMSGARQGQSSAAAGIPVSRRERPAVMTVSGCHSAGSSRASRSVASAVTAARRASRFAVAAASIANSSSISVRVRTASVGMVM